ncbi:MAG: ribosome maturation factor RimM [Sphingobium sp.]
MTTDNPSPSGEGTGDRRPVVLAAIVGAHGVTGEVRLKLFGEGPDSFRRFGSFDAGGRTLTLKTIRPGPNGAVARFVELADRNAAEALRGVSLTVPRSALPPLAEGEFYHVDLIGLPCFSSEGPEIGSIVAVENFGAGDILEVQKADGKRFMVPMHAVEIGDGRATIDAVFID